jgi:hypothetical protein
LALRVVAVAAAPVVVRTVPSEAERVLLSTFVAGLLAGAAEVETVVERTGSFTQFNLKDN